MVRRGDPRQGMRRRRGGGVLQSVLIASSIIVAGFILSKRTEPVAVVPKPTVVAEFDTIEVPVPAQFVPTGTKVKDIVFKTVAFPKHQVPEGALVSVGMYSEAYALSPLPANLPLFKENLSVAGAGSNSVLERIPAGMRAMTIKVDATAAVEGWAGSGSVVDILLIEKEKTTVVAERVKILSAERSVSPVEGSASPNVPSTVTVLVSQEQCLAISTAIPLGRIAFALRSLRDEETWQSTSYTAERLKGGTRARGETRSVVTGYVSIKGKGSDASFALADGRWVRTEVVPEGFLASSTQGR